MSIVGQELAGETSFEMDAKTPTTAQNALLPNCPLGGADHGLRRRPGANGVTPLRGFRSERSGAGEIFKKPPCVADSKPAGRYVAKDMPEVESMPLPETFNAKFIGERGAARPTIWTPRATNPTPGMLWKVAQPVAAVADSVVAHPGGAHEKQCYVDI